MHEWFRCCNSCRNRSEPFESKQFTENLLLCQRRGLTSKSPMSAGIGRRLLQELISLLLQRLPRPGLLGKYCLTYVGVGSTQSSSTMKLEPRTSKRYIYSKRYLYPANSPCLLEAVSLHVASIKHTCIETYTQANLCWDR